MLFVQASVAVHVRMSDWIKPEPVCALVISTDGSTQLSANVGATKAASIAAGSGLYPRFTSAPWAVNTVGASVSTFQVTVTVTGVAGFPQASAAVNVLVIE